MKQLSKLRIEMEDFDTVLPNFEELDVSVSFKDDLKKLTEVTRKEKLSGLIKLSLNEIVAMAKMRVSPIGIYDLYETVEMEYAKMAASI